MEKITARTNEKIKYAVKLGESPSFRRKNGEFILEGARLCSDAAKTGIEIRSAFITSKAFSKYEGYIGEISAGGCICYEISEDIAKKLSDTENPQGVFCVCRSDVTVADISNINPDGKYIFLENVQDPSNLGAVSRTAEALGIDGMIICGGCDIYNPKALRASMGSALRLSIMTCDDAVGLIRELGSKGMLTLASTPDSSAELITEVPMNGGVVCVVGDEGNGVTQEVMSVSAKRVTIPMNGRAESLNASTAAAILIWEMVRK